MDISGGTEAVKYFVSGGFLTQNGLVRDFSDPRNEVNTNYFFRRYNFRSNLDMRATKTLNAPAGPYYPFRRHQPAAFSERSV